MMSKIRDGVVIKVHPETRERLKTAKRGGETYDGLFNRLLDLLQDSRGNQTPASTVRKENV